MKAELRTRVVRVLEEKRGAPLHVANERSLGGGSIANTSLLETSYRPLVIKSVGEGGAALLAAEATGLQLLAGAGSGLRIPEVIHLETEEPAFLLLEYLAPGPPTPDFDERLGRGLAALHRVSRDHYGLESDNFCGATPQPNSPRRRWRDFYAEQRIGFQVERASRAGLLGPRERRELEAFTQRLPSLIDEPMEGPALIHGDLWSGNLLVDASGAPALIDPACYFAHREAELGMMTLFGGFSARVYAAYEEAFPLSPGWRERNRIYQLYHLLNHLNLFGASYLGAVMSAARA